ncbi:hypothetical protein NCCP1664_09710 [Zafaria cholistanensis]|uniref:DUF4229 domain-containing protein n=1 Tax=Zafaria cholistanensis TaxID=1682741 RepID=A0A5A7NNH3_9MICC|nr:DUF4229 domain-containing protein [Zafaria cholistanensis]GER22474.1 hypothetical protein NCCP1664_09710 [Zafaria cholistanensis]
MRILTYTILRLVLFFGAFAALYYGLGWNVWLCAAIALVLAFALTYLFFNRLRVTATRDLAGKLSGGAAKKQRTTLADRDAAAEDRD